MVLDPLYFNLYLPLLITDKYTIQIKRNGLETTKNGFKPGHCFIPEYPNHIFAAGLGY